MILVQFVQTVTTWAACTAGFPLGLWMPDCHLGCYRLPPTQLIPSDTEYLPQCLASGICRFFIETIPVLHTSQECLPKTEDSCFFSSTFVNGFILSNVS